MGNKSQGVQGAPPDFTGAAQGQAAVGQNNLNAQTQTNRPNIFTDFGSQTWDQGPGGQWSMNQNLSSPMQSQLGGFQSGIGGILGNLNTGPVMGGDAARDQAITGAYNQASSRLDPQWSQREEMTRGQLLNQGLDPSSEAYQQQMGSLGRERNDAYSSAMNNAIGQGTQAGSAVFNQNLQSRMAPFNMLQSLMGGQQQLGQGFQAPQFNAAGMAQAPNLLGALEAMGNYNLGSQGLANQAGQQNNGMLGNLFGMGGQGLGALMTMI